MRKLSFYMCILGLTAIAVSCKKSQNETSASNTDTTNNNLQSAGINENRYIDFENSTLSPTDHSLTDNGYTCAFITKGTYSDPQLTTAEFYKGSCQNFDPN